MAHEIERKFLVNPKRLPQLGARRRLIQGYLSDEPEVRFRIVGTSVTLTVKKDIAHGQRMEFEFPRENFAEDEIEKLRAMAMSPPLVKDRYELEHENLTWEIDVYQDRNTGLVTADVELPHIEYPIIFPDWIDPEDDITGHPDYANINLTRRPYQSW